MTRKARRTRLSPSQMVLPGAREFSRAVPVQPVPDVSDLEEEYRYVIADLKRIGITAALMLVFLIVMALLLT
jgi:hypothetical protein